jgi:uncharacterized membrane protein
MAKQVVLAVYPNEIAADGAVRSLKDWDKLDHDVKLNSIGVLVLDEKGRVKQHKVGRHDPGKGAGIGFILGLIGFALTPILGVGVLGWTVGGAVMGSLVHKSLGLGKAELEQLGRQLKDGKAAVGVLVHDEQVSDVSAKLDELGGEVQTLAVDEAALDDAAEATPEIAPSVEAAEAATPAPAAGGSQA